MLHSYAFSNFQSFSARTEVNLTLSPKIPSRGWEMRAPSGERLSTALAIFGANASGKTALLKPLAFVDWFIAHSFSWEPEHWLPVVPHFFAGASTPTEIEFVAEDDEGQVWRYELTVTQERVLREALFRKEKRFNYVFIRSWDSESETYEIKQKGFGFAAKEALKIRPNASMISTAAQYGVETAQRVANLLSVHTNIDYFGRLRFASSQIEEASEFYSSFPTVKKSMVSLLSSWDLGLNDVELEHSESSGPNGTTIKAWSPYGIHKGKDGQIHRLPMKYESSGTQSAFVLLQRLLPAIALGGVALIDEMEADLHPALVESIVNAFADTSTNPKGAQLVFTCHSPGVLSLLQKAQVMFVEKHECESEAYRGDEIQGLRSDDNLRAKYETGALGAIPRL